MFISRGPRIPLPTPSHVFTNARDFLASIWLLAKRSPLHSQMLSRLPRTCLFTATLPFLQIHRPLFYPLSKTWRSTSIPEKENNRSKRPPLIPWFIPNFFRGVGGGEIKDFLRTKIIIFHSNNKKKKEVKTQLTIHSINHITMVLQSPPSCMGAWYGTAATSNIFKVF